MTPEFDEVLRKEYYEYAVKVVCGPVKDPKSAPLNPGLYYTAVNIHNPGAKEAKFRVKVAVALPGQPGPIGHFQTFLLRPDEALELDCALLHKIAGVDGFIKGFAVIQCATRLDAVAVYTAGDLDTGKVVSLHLERVAGTLIKV